MKKWCIALLAALLVSAFACGLAEIAVSRNPLLTPVEITEYVETPDEMFNILLLGIDYGGDTYRSSAKRHALEEGHTDACMVISVNLTQNKLSMISLSRDSLTYVPGIRGIYKLNGAINCGETIEEGLELACKSVSWHLGGVRIDKYIAVDADALVALADVVAPLEFDVDVGFQATNRYVRKGVQQLNGEEIFSYLRARKNASKGQTDLARVDRQRRMIKALFQKVAAEPLLIPKLMGVVTSGEENIFINVGLTDLLRLAPTVLAMDMDNVASYSLTGKIKTFMKNFTFNDPDVRAQVVRDVFGVEMEPLPYVSYEYTRWLTKLGLTAAKYINNAKAIMDYAQAADNPSAEQAEKLAALEAAYNEAVYAFDEAADLQSEAGDNRLTKARTALKEAARAVDDAFGYPGPIKWGRGDYWYTDDMINECVINWN